MSGSDGIAARAVAPAQPERTTSAAGVERAAAELLDAGRFGEVLDTLGAEGGESRAMTRALRLTATGLLCEREGDDAQAARLLDEAFRLGLPHPALLRQLGRYYKRRRRFQRAHHCYALLHAIEPGAMGELLADLPAPELARYAPWALAALRGRPRPTHWFLPPIKAALRQRLGAEGAATVFAAMTGRTRGARVLTAPITALRDFAAEHAAHYEEVVPARTVDLPRPPVFGGGPVAGLRTSTRTVFLAALEGVVASSKSNFLVAGDRVLMDLQEGEAEKVPLMLDVDPIVFGADDRRVTVLVDGAAEGQPLEEAFSLVGINTYAFGHLLQEYLPKLLAVLGRPPLESVALLVDEQVPPQHLEALRLFAGADRPVVVLERGEAVTVGRLWVCAAATYFPLGPPPGVPFTRDFLTLDGDALAAMLDRVRPLFEAAGPPHGRRRLYLTRSDSQWRKLVNRREVEAWFTAQGFEVHDFGALSFREQLALTQAAEVIVGPDGSSLQMSYFARRGTRVGVLSNPYVDGHRGYAAVCASLDQPLSILVGEVTAEHPDYKYFSDYRIDTSRLDAFLEHLLAL